MAMCLSKVTTKTGSQHVPVSIMIPFYFSNVRVPVVDRVVVVVIGVVVVVVVVVGVVVVVDLVVVVLEVTLTVVQPNLFCTYKQ